MTGVGIAKRGFGKALSRTGYSGGGLMADMSEGHERYGISKRRS
jgi:hypothetical protein